MQINQTVNNAVQEGYKLLKQVQDFSLPNTSWTLIEVGGAFKIYIEYKASNIQKPDGGTKSLAGSLNFDVDSFANNVGRPLEEPDERRGPGGRPGPDQPADDDQGQLERPERGGIAVCRQQQRP